MSLTSPVCNIAISDCLRFQVIRNTRSREDPETVKCVFMNNVLDKRDKRLNTGLQT